MTGGGHGQDGMYECDKRQVEYNITRVESNDVKLGNVPNHKSEKRRTGTGQAWFPQNWNEKTIKKAGKYVHIHGTETDKSKNLTRIGVKHNTNKYGRYKGVMVGVYADKNKITTIYPAYYQNIKKGK